jgi:glycerol-3-phosphate dehydrogenase
LVSARRDGAVWIADLSGGRTVSAKAIVNAAGPWVADVLKQRLAETSESRVRLVKGSHILVPRLYEGDHAYILQQPDGRVVFALPFGAFSLIGTTDIAVERPNQAVIEPDEARYLCEAADRYFRKQVTPAQIVWSYSGVRSLYDDGAAEAKAVTRDYHLELDGDAGGKLLSVFGGKITTARALAEEALDLLGIDGPCATSRSALPGGDLTPAFTDWLEQIGAWMPPELLDRLSQAYGTRLREMVGEAKGLDGLGRDYGAGLHESEVRYLVEREFARTADDILWRRTRLGLHLSGEQVKGLEQRLGKGAARAR